MAGGAGSRREELLFRGFTWLGVGLVTFMLAGLSITGAWIASAGNIYYTGSVAGVEIIAFSALSMIVFASTRLRRIVGWLIFVSAVTVCVMNAERAIKQSFDLQGSPIVLRAEADLLDSRAELQLTASSDAQEREIAEQRRLRDRIASLNLELDLMTSQTRIEDAQTRLKALGLYTGPIDGLREELTESAMLKRGEAIRNEIAVTQEKLATPGDLSVSSKADDLKVEAANLRQKADTIDHSSVWIIATLLAFETIRSFAVWAFLLKSTMAVTRAEVNVMETVAETSAIKAETGKAEAENDLKSAEDGEPVMPAPDPLAEPAAITAGDFLIAAANHTPAPEISESPQRKGGLASQHKRRAKIADNKVPVDDFLDGDEERAAA